MAGNLKAIARDSSRKSVIKQLRETGKLPGVVYGKKIGSKPVYLDGNEFVKTIRDVGKNGVFNLEVEGEKHPVILSDLQTDTLKDTFIHADFQEIDMNTSIDANVPIRLTGDPIGVKDGGILQHFVREVTVHSLPSEIPNEIQIDISELEIGQSLTVGDYREASSYEINNEDEEVIASITPPTLVDDTPNQPEEGEEPKATDENEEEE